ncbi:hypothetical protein Sj15T_09960 [Sphingobium sp. TA15]|uniref:Uncharacterized protein n=1 Tax=Sphingobium indicum (strain DSM 16413 / CCM 7287 / MTCC 6362 / UT26 / NBRC 101211 / UT26S) TaxID=452662 RepID=D4Z8R7_SPHIU|nr:hypothetical protein [Sphingobium indicum]BAI98999.1 hypothetical protein SJA_P1-00470 [Sphingobium indicum UT26S]BDD65975.1 hypothetical protein Sj15T_09960 [Sphingobium sp. TA15]
MRIQHSTSIDHLIHAAAETVANEYLSISTATEHEFRNERERTRYAALVRAWGLFAHGDRFLACLAEPAVDAQAIPAERPVRPVCSHCGSDSLVRDASARWDADAQDWAISGVYDCTFCDECSAESDDLCKWVPLPPADPTPLEPCLSARVRILERPRVGGDRFRNREGVIVKAHFAGFYVKLDRTSREKTDKTELVETGFLEVLALPRPIAIEDGFQAFETRREELRRHRKPSRADNPLEFDRLAQHLRQSRINCGADHARCVAQGFASDFGWDADELLHAAGLSAEG